MKWLDLPPVWLVGFMTLVWAIAQVAEGLMLNVPWQGPLAVILAVVGIGLMVLAVAEMMRRRTTFVPRRDPTALVTSGIFRLSRNPIYLGDALVLSASIVWWGAAIAIPLIMLFVMVIRRRFINGEEAALRAVFGGEFDSWAEKTRRWV